jgi:hypothetical protein
MSRSSCRTACGLSSSPMRSGFRRNLSRSCKHTCSSPVLDPAHRRPQLSGVGLGCVAAAAPDLSSYTASLPSPSPRATKQLRLCRDRRSRPPVTFRRPASVDRADTHKVTGRSAGWYPKVVRTHSPEARPAVERLDRMRPVAAAGWQLDVDAGVQRPADRVDGIECGLKWIEEVRHRVVV